MEAFNNYAEQSSDDGESESPQKKMLKPACQVCQVEEHKYKCPTCYILSCSLACSKAHKEESGCPGIRSAFEKDQHLTRMQPMADLTVGTLSTDLTFIEKGIGMSNKSKKDASQKYEESEKRPKKHKNLKYFFKKKRNIYYKTAPSLLFTRS